MGESGAYAFPPVSLLNQVISKNDLDCPRDHWPNMPWFWDLVILFGSDSIQAPPSTRSGDSAFQRSSSQEFQQSESTCLAPY